MTERRVIVIGSGIAGTAACISAARAGAMVTLVRGGSGASVLFSGAIDFRPWEASTATLSPSSDFEIESILDALAIYTLSEGHAWLVATSGLVRRSDGHDRGLLDLAPLTDGPVLVPRCDLWDADGLANAWNDSRFAKGVSRKFLPVDAELIRFTNERAFINLDLARAHDHSERIEWLAERLKEAICESRIDPAAIVLPPWLGASAPQSDTLRALIGIPCGEALDATGAGVAGLRFEAAREKALSSHGIAARIDWAARVEVCDGPWHVHLENGDRLPADAVVLASGGLVGGGLAYTPSEAIFSTELPPVSREPFRSSIDAPVRLGAHALPLKLPSTLFGLPPESLAWPFAHDPLMDHVGVLVDAEQRVFGAKPGLFAAGELVADERRTWLSALASGARAGKNAARPSAI